MLSRQIYAIAVVISLAGAGLALAEEVRYYQQDGITYRETRRTVQRPVTETHLRESMQTVYREQQTSELREQVRTWWSPVTEYRCETYLVGRWNPFVQPYFSSRWVPRTRWETRSDVTQVPVTCRRLVPEIRTVQVPVTVHRMLPEEVVTRAPVGGYRLGTPATLPPSPTLARREVVGGVARLDNDPPRYGASTAWRASTAAR